MPQVVNEPCAVCGARIRCILDGDYCVDCGSPVHDACRIATNGVARPGICATCSADVTDAEATRERLMKLEREAQEHANLNHRQAASEQKRRAGQSDMTVGAVVLAGGLGFTAFDFLMTASDGGGTFLIATGAIMFGAYRLVRGVFRATTA